MDNVKRLKGWAKAQKQFEVRLDELKALLNKEFKCAKSIFGLIKINESARKCAMQAQGLECDETYLRKEIQQ